MVPNNLLTVEDVFSGTILYNWIVYKHDDIDTFHWQPPIRDGFERVVQGCQHLRDGYFKKWTRDEKIKNSNPFYSKEEW